MIVLAPGTVCRSCFSPGTLSIYGSKKQVLALELYHLFHRVGRTASPFCSPCRFPGSWAAADRSWLSPGDLIWSQQKACEHWVLLAPYHTGRDLGLLQGKLLSQSKWQSQSSNTHVVYFFLQSLCCLHPEPLRLSGNLAPLLDDTKFTEISVWLCLCLNLGSASGSLCTRTTNCVGWSQRWNLESSDFLVILFK